jgi:hypothetical protein
MSKKMLALIQMRIGFDQTLCFDRMPCLPAEVPDELKYEESLKIVFAFAFDDLDNTSIYFSYHPKNSSA